MTDCYYSYLGHQDHHEEGYLLKTRQHDWKTSKSIATFVTEMLSQICHDMNVEFGGRQGTFQVQEYSTGKMPARSLPPYLNRLQLVKRLVTQPLATWCRSWDVV